VYNSHRAWRIHATAKRLDIHRACGLLDGDARQWVNYDKPNLSAPTPRTADGNPDLSGAWQAEASPIPELINSFCCFTRRTRTSARYSWTAADTRTIRNRPGWATRSARGTAIVGK
jgi:hypothetical protein